MSPSYLLKFNSLPSIYPFLVIILVVIIVGILFKFKNLGNGWTHIVLRSLLLFILVIAFADPVIKKTSYRSTGVLLVDVSDSMDQEVADSLINKAKAYLKDGFDYQVLPFAEKPAKSLLSLEELKSFQKFQKNWNVLNIGSTNLEKALSSPLLFDISNVLLISDGYETSGDVFSKIPDFQNEGIKIFPLAPDKSSINSSGLSIINLYAPLVISANKSTDVRISIKNSSNDKEEGVLKVLQDEKVIYEKEISVNGNQEDVIVVTTEPFEKGIQEISAILKPIEGKSNFLGSSDQIYISTEEKERVLLLSGSSKESEKLKEILENQSYILETKVSAGTRLNDDLDFSKYSAVILNNISFDELPRGSASKIENYVANGGGFIMIGGNKSFGLGGYKDTAIADILPVNVIIPQKEKKRLNVAVQMVLDKSASMNQNNRMAFVKDAAVEVLKSLKNDDYVGIIGFDDYPFHLVPIEKLATVRAKAIQRLAQLYPAKTTRLLAALNMAKEDILKAQAGRKHVIILTDGKLPDAENYNFYMQIVDYLRVSGVTVSTFVIGNDYVPILTEMADRGGGAFYRTTNPSNLPRLFLHDVNVNTGEKTQKENQRFSVETKNLLSTKIETFPPLLGYIETTIKPQANLELYLRSEKNDPLLASWQYKKGKTLAYTSDISGRWSEFWVGWGKIHTFWSDLIDSVRPSAGDAVQNVQFELRHFINQGKLYFDLAIFSDGVAGDVHAELKRPDDSIQQIVFNQLARGHYQVGISDLMAGRYEITPFVGQRRLTKAAIKVSGELFDEKKGLGFSMPSLEAIANATGGEINPDIKALSSNRREVVEEIPLNNWLCLLALLIFCLEIACNAFNWNLIYKRKHS